MTSSVAGTGAAPDQGAGLEVCTLAGDTMRASLRVTGLLERSTVALLVCVVRTHLTAGRRYVRVDLAAAELADQSVVAVLCESNDEVSALGGMLVFENAGPQIMAAVGSASLFVRAAD